MRPAEAYLREVGSSLQGSRAAKERLLTELRDHIDDAVAASGDAEEGERQAVSQLGEPAAVAAAWAARCERLQRRRRRRLASLAAGVAVASMLAVAQHAEGSRTPAAPAHPAVGACVESTQTPANCRPAGR